MFRPGVPCETQERPNLNAPSGSMGEQRNIEPPEITDELQKTIDERLRSGLGEFGAAERLGLNR